MINKNVTTVASRKAKGRLLQQKVRDAILTTFPGLSHHDVESTAMGQNGEDIKLSAAAREVFPWSVECKARKTGFTMLYDALAQADQGDGRRTVAVVKQDRKEPLAVMTLNTFMELVKNASN